MKHRLNLLLSLILVLVMCMSAIPASASEGDTIENYDIETGEVTTSTVSGTSSRSAANENPAHLGDNTRSASSFDEKAVQHLMDIGVMNEDGEIDNDALLAIPTEDMEIGGSGTFSLTTDDRTAVRSPTTHPYRTIGYVITTYPNGDNRRGSAYMMGYNAAMTAGHCIYNANRGGWATRVTFLPARTASSTPYGPYTASRLRKSSSYPSDSSYSDWGIIEFSSDLGLGYMGMRRYSSVATETSINVTGYPAKVKGVDDQLDMFTGSGEVLKTGNNQVYVDAYVSPGNSGGPIHDGKIAVGTIARSASSGNFGCGFTDQIWNILMEYRG